MKAIWKSVADSKAARTLRALHEEEDGAMEMKMIMFLAIAALVAVMLYKFGGEVWQWLTDQWGKIKGKESL